MSYHDEIEQHIDRFPEMPPLCQSLLGYLNDPDVDFTVIKDLVQYDPGLTANILKLANSVYFGPAQQVSSLQAALVRLGTQRIFELVLSLSVSGHLLSALPGYGLQTRDLLRHCIWTAVAAQELAELLGMKDVDTVFTVGLLHDLGLLLLDPFMQKEQIEFGRALESGAGESFVKTERTVLGFDHPQAGARILSNWQLGEEIVDTVRWHHTPEEARGHHDLVNLIHLADMLSLSEGVGTGVYGLKYHASADAIKAVGLKKKHIEYTASKTLDRMRNLEQILA
jgi:putative nucleotidyltransferase with HDIG domain